ncbi:peptide-methionine (S)-S-oxide reductase MsrA [Pusillimonas sp. ANT_WB101]|uniref:peptide-methionine (S)-S-oxide reductase MsrA n=1 Tax=Pusillimonas sp. ANT_WB101 TaxID=2597356 RepID=UPI0011F07F10|nr:peptide-methionine (S)-S-oxide reductase MsrA [Pusillimonas sp. ANT_WB101]KAA0890565.1 peptide-methionine (S)-S-oxide reductase MsrA [Pusillimonas sp. ANT_WB101]
MSETAILGGGCFWCLEPVFKSLRGVSAVIPGYAGGHVQNPTYEQVCSTTTGHIELVQVTFDPTVISYETLLQVFFATHDPTTLDRQGNDVGSQYASAIFCQTTQQKDTAQKVIDEVQADLSEPVVTRLLGKEPFWPAEQYHHDYYARNPAQGYCHVVISPKMAKFRKRYASLIAA